VKALIIGAGMIGETHARVAKAMDMPLALCDSVRERVEEVGDAFGIAERYTDFREAVMKSGAEAAVICSPNHLHEQHAVFAMEHGLHVLCEKPMAATAGQAGNMLRASRQTGRRLMIGYIVRTYDALEKVQQLLRGGGLGRVASVRCVLATPETLDVAKTRYRLQYETGGGIIYDYTHELDYCGYLFGRAAEVFGYCDLLLKGEHTVDDNAELLIRYQSGVTLMLHMDYIQRAGRGACGRSFEIVCESGFLSCDFKTVTVDWYHGGREAHSFPLDWDASFTKQMKTFIALCGGADAAHASGEDGLSAIELADALYRAVCTGQPQKL